MRLFVHVEGQTEEEFVNEVLASELYKVGYTSVSARIRGAARARKRRGGICGWPTFREEVARHLKSDGGAYATTFVDYYALPSGGPNGWPGRDTCGELEVYYKAKHIEAALKTEFETYFGAALSQRFLPFVAMHEFEGFLFSDPHLMAVGMGFDALSANFKAIRDSFDTPEHINDSRATAPSKRILALAPGYNKILHGNVAAIEVTLPKIREQCPVFSDWMDELERLVAP
jgi:hypothetical protein